MIIVKIVQNETFSAEIAKLKPSSTTTSGVFGDFKNNFASALLTWLQNQLKK